MELYILGDFWCWTEGPSRNQLRAGGSPFASNSSGHLQADGRSEPKTRPPTPRRGTRLDDLGISVLQHGMRGRPAHRCRNPYSSS